MNDVYPYISKHKRQLTSHIPAMLSWVVQADGDDGKCSWLRYDVYFLRQIFQNMSFKKQQRQIHLLALRFTAGTHPVCIFDKRSVNLSTRK